MDSWFWNNKFWVGIVILITCMLVQRGFSKWKLFVFIRDLNPLKRIKDVGLIRICLSLNAIIKDKVVNMLKGF